MKPLRQKFFEKIQKDTNTLCVIWAGGKNAGGYGRLRIGESPEGKQIFKQAHHVSWFLKHGYWPRQLLHTCDNPACVRLSHLREGSQKENMRDMVQKGRDLKPNSKITFEAAQEIRGLLDTTNVTTFELAKKYDLPQPNISLIYHNKIWVDPERGSRSHRARRYLVGTEMLTVGDLAIKTGLTSETIRDRLRRGLTGEALCASKHRAPRKPWTRKVSA